MILDFAEYMIIALGGAGIFSACLAWLIKTFLSQKIAKELERLKLGLVAENQIAIEKLKNDLQKSQKEGEIQYGALHQQRVLATSAIQQELRRVRQNLAVSLVITSVVSGKDADVENVAKVIAQVEEYENEIRDSELIIEKYRIFLSKKTCNLIDNFFENSRDFHIQLMHEKFSSNRSSRQADYSKSVERGRAMLVICESIMEKIEAEFRSLLGV